MLRGMAAPTWVLKTDIVTRSESNLRQGWRLKHKRTKLQKQQILLALVKARVPQFFLRIAIQMGLRPEVHFVRLGPNELDDDNLVGSNKGVRDSIAYWGDINDKIPDVRWTYAQEKRKRLGLRVEITLRRPEEPRRIPEGESGTSTGQGTP